MIFIVFCSQEKCAEYKYIGWLKALVNRYPVPLSEDEGVLDWWPLRNDLKYRYKIANSRWHFGKKWINREFTLTLIQDKEDEKQFHLHVEGFDEFPYKGLVIRGQRVFVLSDYGEEPLIVFPLFEHMFFADEEYELGFLKTAILEASEKHFHGPVCTHFWTVSEVSGDVYFIEQATTRGQNYRFVKNVGIVKWHIPGGYTIELINAEPAA
jgi:hypothetical protein